MPWYFNIIRDLRLSQLSAEDRLFPKPLIGGKVHQSAQVISTIHKRVVQVNSALIVQSHDDQGVCTLIIKGMDTLAQVTARLYIG